MVLASVSANAITAAQFEKAKAGNQAEWVLMKMYLVGLLDAFSAANLEFGARGQPPMFCKNSGPSLNPDNLVELTEQQVKRLSLPSGSTKADTDINIALLFALKHEYPCKNEK